MQGALSFPLPPEAVAGDGLAALTAGLPLGRRRSGAAQLTLYDTFDARLWREGLCLRALVAAGRRELQLLTFDGEIKGRLPLPDALDFAAGLPAGRLQEAVAEVSGERRLLPALTVEKRIVARPLLASKGLAPKRIGYLSVVDRRVVPAGEGGGRNLRRRLRIEPLRGYADACRPFVRLLEARVGRPAEGLEDELAEALAVAGSWLERQSLRPDLHLEPEEPAGVAALAILGRLRDALRAQEHGVVADLDREFLHDYRVALRRLRSAVGQLRRLFPAREVEALRTELAWLGGETGPKRDLDVLLEMLPGVLEAVPGWVREGFEPVRSRLTAEAATAQAELAKSFTSSRYEQALGALDGFLERRGRARRPPAEARRPIREVASERLARAARRVLERAEALGPNPEPAALHGLRIACKKLRYLLEFFRSLYPKAEIDRVIQALKGLQDVLGTLNDLANQEQALRSHNQALAATGYVVARLDECRARELERFAGALRAFLRRDNQERIARLFTSSEPEVSP